MQIVKVPSPILTKKAKRVTKFDSKLKKLVEKMLDILKKARDPEGVGLAAPQVGISKRIFIIQTNPTVKPSKAKYETFINPEIISQEIKKSRNQEISPQNILEGCLSIDNVWGFPERAKTITIEYKNTSNKKITQKFSGFVARLIQHELDHLNGVLFTHRVLEQKKELYQIEPDEKTNEPVLIPLEI